MKATFLFFWLMTIFVVTSAQGRGCFEINLPHVGGSAYPRLMLETQQDFSAASYFGFWVLADYSRPGYVPESWKERGYIIDDIYNLNLKAGLTFGSKCAKLIVGASFSGNKDYFGPLLGMTLSGRHWYFQALGLYATNTIYKAHYSEQEELVPHIYICGFDPNSWYRIKCLCSISKQAKIGVISERFYGTGPISEYDLGTCTFKFMFGKDLEFDENVFQFGLMFKI
jgi:hypothetical protein